MTEAELKAIEERASAWTRKAEDWNELGIILYKDIPALLAHIRAVEAERNALGNSIAEAAIKVGIINRAQTLTGPQMLMLCDDLAESSKRLEAERDKMRDALEYIACRWVNRSEDEINDTTGRDMAQRARQALQQERKAGGE